MKKAVFIAVLMLAALPARAGNVITQDMVTRQHAAMQAALNERRDRAQAVTFLHNHISESAQFRMTVDNPALPAAHQGTPMTLSKADYINSYLQGTNYIADYSAAIETTGFSFNAQTGEAMSTEVITERGAMLNPHDMRSLKGRPFVSRTACQTRHILKDGALLTAGGTCHTQVSYEQLI